MTLKLEDHQIKNIILSLWEVPHDICVQLINVSENKTYEVISPQGFKAVLRVNRLGYRNLKQIQAELDWIEALSFSGFMKVPKAIKGKNEHFIQVLDLPHCRQKNSMILYEYINGNNLSEETISKHHFYVLGKIAATLHSHVLNWQKANSLARDHWNLDSILGARPIWGRWQDAPNITQEFQSILNQVATHLKNKISQYHSTNPPYGLIHADMRLANIIVANNEFTLIDFDDCGFSWFMYDFAASLSFLELHAESEDFKWSWVDGYRSINELSSDNIQILDSFVMLRRLALLAWVGSHLESDEPKLLADNFAHDTAILAEQYLMNHG